MRRRVIAALATAAGLSFAACGGGVFEVVGGRAQDPGRLVGAFGGRKDDG